MPRMFITTGRPGDFVDLLLYAIRCQLHELEVQADDISDERLRRILGWIYPRPPIFLDCRAAAELIKRALEPEADRNDMRDAIRYSMSLSAFVWPEFFMRADGA